MRAKREYLQEKIIYLERRLARNDKKSKEYLDLMASHIQALQNYVLKAIHAMDPYTRNKFISSFGNPPGSEEDHDKGIFDLLN